MTPVSSIPERMLVRDCLHCCQGGQGGRFVSWFDRDGVYDVKNDEVDASGQISVPQRQLIWKITEVGRLVRRLNEAVAGDLTVDRGVDTAEAMAGTARDSSPSVVHDGIKAAVRTELRACYRVIAVLEGQSTAPDPKHVLTLRRTQVWLEEVKQRLDIVARCVDATMGVCGGEALNILYSMSRHGDAFVVDTIAPLLNAACAPYFMQLEQWLTHGTISSSSNAAGRFISECSAGSVAPFSALEKGTFMIEKLRTPKDLPYYDWKEGFAIDLMAQPQVFDASFARDVLSVGKAVYFLRKYSEDESKWNEALGRLRHVGQLTQIGSTFSAAQRLVILKQLVHEAKDVMDEALLKLIKDDENIFGHLENIKRYVLLSKGDFVRVFIDLADDELKGVRDVSEYSEYSLQGCVEKALMDTNAVDAAMGSKGAMANRDLLDCIQVRRLGQDTLLHGSLGVTRASDGAIVSMTGSLETACMSSSTPAGDGWSIFGLGYVLGREDAPAAVVLDAASMKQYADTSSILWSMKRADHILSLSWRRLESTSCSLNGLRILKREQGVDPQAVVGNAPMLLRYLHSLRNGVAQFVSTLQSHVVYRVIEPAWTTMIAQMGSATDLDGLLKAHAAGLRTIARGTFTERKRSKTGDTKATLKAALSAAMDVFVPIEKLCVLVDRCVSDFADDAARTKKSEKLGNWTEHDPARNPPQPISDETLDEIKRTAVRIRGVFSRHRDQFYASLPASTREHLRR